MLRVTNLNEPLIAAISVAMAFQVRLGGDEAEGMDEPAAVREDVPPLDGYAAIRVREVEAHRRLARERRRLDSIRRHRNIGPRLPLLVEILLCELAEIDMFGRAALVMAH